MTEWQGGSWVGGSVGRWDGWHKDKEVERPGEVSHANYQDRNVQRAVHSKMGKEGPRAGAGHRDRKRAASGAEESGNGKIPSCRESLAVFGVARAIERMGVAARNRRGETDGRGKEHGHGYGKGNRPSSRQTGSRRCNPVQHFVSRSPRRLSTSTSQGFPPLSHVFHKVPTICTHANAPSQMVTVYKWVLISSPIPIFFLFCQLAIAVVLLLLCQSLRFLSLPAWNTTTALRLWPLIAVNVMGLIFNNLCLQYVDASFYQIARGLVLPITVGLSFVLQSSPPSARATYCCVGITAGFGVGVLYDNHATGKLHTSL